MTHHQIVAALQRDYQLDDARASRRGCYPIRKPAPRTSSEAMAANRARPAAPGGTGRRTTSSRARRAFEYLEDKRLPARITLVEPAAFALACVQAAWGPHGPQN
jgi:hypothetical protein